MSRLPAAFWEKPISWLEPHDRACCERAWAWFVAMDASRHGGNNRDPPRWLREEFEWGPSRWPVATCEAARSSELDCGVFAALARALLAQRGTEVAAVQLVERYNEENVENWRRRWRDEGAETGWLADDKAYHEIVGILVGEELTVWDPVDCLRVEPSGGGGYGKPVSIRVLPEEDRIDETFLWDDRWIPASEWTPLM